MYLQRRLLIIYIKSLYRGLLRMCARRVRKLLFALGIDIYKYKSYYREVGFRV
jgi:hypothetical protein